MINVIAFDEGWTTTTQAEHGTLDRVSGLGLRAVLACTHFRPAGDGRPPRVATTVHVAGSGTRPHPDPDLDPLLAAHTSGRSGRAFVFPGMASLDQIVTVATVLSASAVDDVITLGGARARPSDRIDTQKYLRPEFSAGRLVLRTRPSVGVDLVPFEQPNPTPCCAAHP
jgi:hypothetical protein